jgi:hypothetical protein
MTTSVHAPARHRPVNPPPLRVRARVRVDWFGSCRSPASWAAAGPGRGLNRRVGAQARALCSGCPVPRPCRRAVLAALTQPSTRPGQTALAHGAWGGFAAREVREPARRSRERRTLARTARLTRSRAAA